MELEMMYEQLGVSRAVSEYGQQVLSGLKERFERIDQISEHNQAKVLHAMQKNRVNATHFAATTGYGYNDDGRDNLERVYADALIGNVRSRHVLQKAGFTETHHDEVFQYYVCSRNTWKRPDTSCRGPV